MRLRTSLILLAVAGVLTALSATLAWRERRAREAPLSERRLISIGLKQIETFQVFKGGMPVAQFARNEQGRWKVTLPTEDLVDAAEPSAIQELGALVELSFVRPVEGLTPADAGLTAEAAMQFTVRTEDQEQSLRIGRIDPEKNVRYVIRLREPEVVHAINADLTRVLDRPLQSFRTMNLFDLGRQSPARIVLDPGASGSGGSRVVLDRAGDGWILTRPVRWPADPKQVDRLIRLCRTLRADKVAVGDVTEPAAHGVGPGAPTLRLRVDDQDQVVRFRGAGDQQVHAFRVGRRPLYGVGRALLRELEHLQADADAVNRYRQRILNLLQNRIPGAIHIRTAEGTLGLTREEDAWRASGARSFAVEKRAVEEVLVQALQVLVIQRFVSEKPEPEAYGLQKPAWRFDCMDATGARIAGLNVSAPDEKGRIYFSVDGRPQVLELHPRIAQILCQPFVRYRDRDLVQFPYDQAWEITIRRGRDTRVYRSAGRGHWQLLKPETRLLQKDSNRLVWLVARLSRLRCEAYQADRVQHLDEFGLDQGGFRVIVTVRPPGVKPEAARTVLDLLIGKPAGEASQQDGRTGNKAPPRFACLRGERTVFVLSGETVQAIDRDFK